MPADWIFAAAFMAFLAAAAWGDLRARRIPNALTGAMAALGPLAVLLAFPAEGALAGALLAGAVMLAVTWTMFELGWLGGGDAKLASAAALWLGGPATATFALATALFGAVLSLGLLALSRRSAAAGPDGPAGARAAVTVPYAVAMAPAGLVALDIRLGGLFWG